MNPKLKETLQAMPMAQAVNTYKVTLDSVRHDPELYWPVVAKLALADRFFLLTHLLHRADAIHPWLYERCREVEANPDEHLDLWARFHYKSTFITFAGGIQEILKNPEITICILSYNNATATAFLSQIKSEFTKNEDLKNAFPNIFYSNPERDAESWSLDKGITVKRQGNPKEATVEAYGLVDNQPVGRHFTLRIYDDVVTPNSVGTSDMIHKTTEAWELSLSLGDGVFDRMWTVGTRYSPSDTYQTIIDREFLVERIHPATDDGTVDGNLVLMTKPAWAKLVRGSSDYTLACQQFLNPLAGKQQEFDIDWVRRWEVRPRNLNVYILVDPAGEKTKGPNCNTAMVVIGVDAQMNKYLLDGACHKMQLEKRWEMLSKLFFKWRNAAGVQTVTVGYERYGMQSDISHFEFRMKMENKYFPIQEVGGPTAKDDRIRRLLPDFKNWAIFLPHVEQMTRTMAEYRDRGQSYLLAKPIKRVDSDNNVYELTDFVINKEFKFFPHGKLKDFMDAMARMYDLELIPPMDQDYSHLEMEDEFDNFGGASYYNGVCMEPDISECH